MLRLASILLVLMLTPRVDAQRIVTFDTVSAETGSAVTCGFCAAEKFGVVFRELEPPARGVEAEDFPFVLRGVRVALANASVIDGSCEGSLVGGTGIMSMQVYGGTTLPSGDISDNPEEGPWDGETLLIEAIDVPLMRSALETEGGTRYQVELNDLQIRDPETDEDIRVEAPMTYVRVAFTFGEEADRNPSCESMGLVSPSAFPMRDTDGVIADERSFIFGAGGLGWQWNEDVGVDGDWAVRLEIEVEGTPMPDAGGVDAGPVDSGAALDAGGSDASSDGATGDAGSGGGGGCAAGGTGSALLFGMTLAWMRRRRT